MGNLSCIYWFSGTGNSLYAAKQLSAALGDIPLVQITRKTHPGGVGGSGEKVGFVFPSYYGNLPRIVRSFIKKLEIEPGTYLFSVVTMGAAGQGSVAALDTLLKEKGHCLNYGRGIMMPRNYVLMYNPADSEKSVKAMDKVDAKLKKYAAEIEEEKQLTKKMPITAANLYKNIAELDAAFTVGENCTGCGLCKQICPVENIRLDNGKPEWLHHCEHCVACISWCPVGAIEYGNRTQARRRYRNPKVKAEELVPLDKNKAG